MKEAGGIRVTCLYGIWGACDGKQESRFLYHVIASVNHIIEGDAVHGAGLVSRDAVLKGMGQSVHVVVASAGSGVRKRVAQRTTSASGMECHAPAVAVFAWGTVLKTN
jgi:hypothetical protein